MTAQQRNKMFKLLSEKLIPAVIELQHTGMYPKIFKCKYTFIKINKIITLELGVETELAIRMRRINLPANMPYENNVLDLKEINTWCVDKRTLLINSDRQIMHLSESIIAFLKEAQEYQNKIKNIFDFSSTLSLPITKMVLIEKFIA